MIDVYEFCPELENEKFVLRLIEDNDCDDLLKVYSDKNAVPFFNGDNCNGDDFYYATKERMKQAVDFWIFSYRERYFVRWVIFDKSKKEVIGTIELFHRDSVIDAFDNCGLLRLDLRSDYEKKSVIENILSLIIEPTFDLFYCDKIVTKCWVNATDRKSALESLNFFASDKNLVGNDGTEYSEYWILEKR